MDVSTSAEPPADVLIVGAGPTGLVLAGELARHGVRVRIVDQKTGPSEHSKALGVQPRTLELLEKLDVTPRMLARGRRIPALHLHYKQGDIARLNIAPLDSHYDYLLAIPQSDTETLLIQRLAELGVQVQWQTRLSKLTATADRVQAVLAAADGRETTLDVPWLVGCDGIHSQVRSLLGVPFEGEAFPEWFVLADVHYQGRLSADEAHAWLSPAGPLAAFPLPGDGILRVVGPLADQPLDQRPQIDLAVVARLVEERIGDAIVVSDPLWLSSFLIQRRIVAEFRRGRVLLAGDAAHVHSPVGGQGMNLGIQDAFNLAWKLALVAREGARPQLLDSYQQERWPIDAATVRNTRLATLLITVHKPWQRRWRDRLLRWVSRREFLRSRLVRAMSGIGIGYRDSSIVGQTAHLRWRERRAARGAPVPGQRAPDVAWNGSGPEAPARLHEWLTGTRHVLLYFCGDRAEPERARALADVLLKWSHLVDVLQIVRPPVAAAHAGWRVVHDVGAIAHRRYGAVEPSLFLVRPDGYLGWRSLPADPQGLSEYLVSLFR